LFYKKYEEIGKNIEKAAEAYRVGNGHIERYRHQLDNTVRLEGLYKARSLPENISRKIR